MGLNGINFNSSKAAEILRPLYSANSAQVQGTEISTKFTGVNTTTRKDLANGVTDITNRARINAPAAQGLASVQELEKGQLVSGYHFDNLGKYDTKLFALKYNSANTPRIAQGTNYACDGIEYAGVAGNIQAAKDSPFAGLFTA